MDNIESYIWLFCLDHPDTNITQVFDFSKWIMLLVITFFQKFLQIYSIRRSLNAVIWQQDS